MGKRGLTPIICQENIMSLAENIYHHSRRLPEQTAREALDFIQFLEQRYIGNPFQQKQSDDTEVFLEAVEINDGVRS